MTRLSYIALAIEEVRSIAHRPFENPDAIEEKEGGCKFALRGCKKSPKNPRGVQPNRRRGCTENGRGVQEKIGRGVQPEEEAVSNLSYEAICVMRS